MKPESDESAKSNSSSVVDRVGACYAVQHQDDHEGHQYPDFLCRRATSGLKAIAIEQLRNGTVAGDLFPKDARLVRSLFNGWFSVAGVTFPGSIVHVISPRRVVVKSGFIRQSSPI